MAPVMSTDHIVGAARASAMNRTGGAYQPASPHPSRVLPVRQVAALVKETARSTANLLRVSVKRFGWLRRRQGVIDRYFADHSVKKLHLGSGPVLLEGWLNADLRPRTDRHIFLDVTELFPFPDQSLDYIFSEHLIGDLTYPQAGMMLGECHRVLRRGGRLRIGTPSLAKLAELYSSNRGDIHRRYVEWAIEEFVGWADAPLEGLVINNLFQEHPFVYDPATLRHVLQRAGFADVVEHPFGCSNDSHFIDVDSHGRVLGHPEISRFESVTMEATRH